jgi:ABC-type iron transport system FetAB ATPase subunit
MSPREGGAASGDEHESPRVLELQELSADGLGPLDLRVEPGERVCISGPSGCGKSRLLRAIVELDLCRGEVRLGSRRRSAMPAHEWRLRVALLPPRNHWWLGTAGAHLDARAAPARLAELDLDTSLLDRPVEQLSSGEAQRLALVRLLDREPDALLLDEPTANLDENAARRVEALVTKYAAMRGAPVLWVSHSPSQIGRIADRQLRLRDGGLETGATIP